MLIIDAALVHTISAYHGRLDATGIALERRDLAQRQPAILALLARHRTEHGVTATELALDILTAVWRMFEAAAEDPLETVPGALVETLHAQNTQLLGNLQRVDARFATRLLDPRHARQPHVMRYVLARCAAAHGAWRDALPVLAPRSATALLTLLRTAIDAMHLGNPDQTQQDAPASNA